MSEKEPSSAAGNEPPAKEGVAEDPASVDWRAQAEQIRDNWLRAEAELQNFRRRAAREREEDRRAAEEAVLLELLAVADDLERALVNGPATGESAAWAQGVDLVMRRISDYLRRQGVDVVDPLGEPFDPTLHEAVLEVDGGETVAPGAVAEVVVKGYRRGDRALRPARVIVARQPASQSRDADEGSARD